MNKKILLNVLAIFCLTGLFAQNQMDLPVTFDDATVDYGFVNFGAGIVPATTIVVNPSGPATDSVASTVKTAGAEFWAGTTISDISAGGTPDLANAMAFSITQSKLQLHVYPPAIGTPIMIKIEDPTDLTNNTFYEAQATTSVMNAWETLEFDFSAPTATGVNSTDLLNHSFTRVSVFFNFVPGPPNGAGETYLWDSLALVPAPSTSDVRIKTVDVSSGNITIRNYGGVSQDLSDWQFCSLFGYTALSSLAGYTSPLGAGSEITLTWASINSGNRDLGLFNTNTDFNDANNMEDFTQWGSGGNGRESVAVTKGIWSAGDYLLAGGSPYNYTGSGDPDDGINFWSITQSLMSLPITFDDPLTHYGQRAFFATAPLVVTDVSDPAASGRINVKRVEKQLNSDNWAGFVLDGDNSPTVERTLATPLSFSASQTQMSIDVYTTFSGTMRFKLENEGGGPTVETETSYTGMAGWQTLVFNFSNEVGGTPPLNLANTFDKLVIFPNFAGPGTGEIYYFDSIQLLPACAPLPDAAMAGPDQLSLSGTSTALAANNPVNGTGMWSVISGTGGSFDDALIAGTTFNGVAGNAYVLRWTIMNACGSSEDDVEISFASGLIQIDIPVTFDDPSVDYGTVDFGGNMSSVEADPTNASNQVGCAIKTLNAQTWAGTTMDAVIPEGFANAIPLTASASEMTVDVYSPLPAGTTIMLKVEDKSFPGNTHFLEAQATTTMMNAWETLTFDFSSPTGNAGGAALGTSTFDIASIFFDFGSIGAQDTFYWDNVDHVPGATPTIGQSPYCEYTAFHFENPAEIASEAVLTINNLSPTEMIVEIRSANADAIDDLVIAGGTAAVSGLNNPSPGIYNRVLTWVTPPDTASFNVLWSKASFGGFWQLIPGAGALQVAFQDTCPPPPLAIGQSPYCEYTAFHFENPAEIASEAVLTINNQSPTEMIVEIRSANADAIDDLVIAGGTAAVSGLNNPSPGVYNRVLTWVTPPDTASFNVLWSKASFGGFWQLIPGAGALQVAFQDTCPPPPPALAQMDLPLTWDDAATVSYGFSEFGGVSSSAIVSDPNGGSNMVGTSTKGVGAQFWAGTTITAGIPNGLASPIPFTPCNQVITMRFYSPAVGIPIQMKVEDSNNNTIIIETLDTTSVMNDWETLTFDFSNPSAGAWNAVNSYDVISIFYNFVNAGGAPNGNGEVYYYDDVIFLTSYTWNGSSSTDWNDPSNWDEMSVPLSCSQVTIPNVSGASGNFPDLTTTSALGNVTIVPGAEIKVSPGAVLELNGTLTNLGTVILESDMTGTGVFDDFTSGGTYAGSGTFIVQRYVTNGSGLGQRYFGSPVESGTISGLDMTYAGMGSGQLVPNTSNPCNPDSLESTSPYSNLFYWDESATFATACEQEGWHAMDASTILTPGRAYSGWMNDGSTLSISGTPNTGNVSFTTSGVSGNAPATADGWHLLSNPFPSPLDVASVMASGFTSPQTYNGGTGPYSGTFDPVLMAGNNLAIMQGFMAFSNTGAVFNALQADRNTGAATWQSADELMDHLLTVEASGNGFADRTYVYFSDNAGVTNQFDPNGDCVKRNSANAQPTIYTKLNGEQLSLNGNPLSSLGQSIEMGLHPGAIGFFELSFDGIENFPAQTSIYVEDKLTGTFHNVEEGNYGFTVDVNHIDDRFFIHFVKPVELSVTDMDCDRNLGQLSLINEISNQSYEIVDDNGTLLSTGSVNTLSEDLTEGMYDLIVYDDFGGSQSYQFNVEALDAIEADIYISVVEVDVNDIIEFQNLTNGTTNITWDIDGNIFNNLNSLTYSFDEVGEYEVSAFVENHDCSDEFHGTITVSEKTTSLISINETTSINIYLVGNDLVFEMDDIAKEDGFIEIYNILGQQIINHKVEKGTQINNIDVSTFVDGYYVVRISIGSDYGSRKVLVNK